MVNRERQELQATRVTLEIQVLQALQELLAYRVPGVLQVQLVLTVIRDRLVL